MLQDRPALLGLDAIEPQDRAPSGPEKLLRTVYGSTAVRDLSEEELVSLLDVSSRRNVASNITGALAYHDRSFIQVLEGPEAVVDALLVNIIRDTRNTGVMVYDRSIRDERSFARWSMGWARTADLAQSAFDSRILYLGDTPDLLVNSMLEAFRRSVRLDLQTEQPRLV